MKQSRENGWDSLAGYIAGSGFGKVCNLDNTQIISAASKIFAVGPAATCEEMVVAIDALGRRERRARRKSYREGGPTERQNSTVVPNNCSRSSSAAGVGAHRAAMASRWREIFARPEFGMQVKRVATALVEYRPDLALSFADLDRLANDGGFDPAVVLTTREWLEVVLQMDAELCAISRAWAKEEHVKELRSIPYREYLQTPEWRATRETALQRAHYRCQVCAANNRLNVHHRTYARLGREAPEDLTVLCEDCHSLFHERMALAEDGRA